ncbi:MAG: DUF3857 domain-containing protein [Planctomycetota bacterium]
MKRCPPTLFALLALAGAAAAQEAPPAADEVLVTTRGGGAPIRARLVGSTSEALQFEADGWRFDLSPADALLVRGAKRWWVPAAQRAEDRALLAEGRGDDQAAFAAWRDQLQALVAAQRLGGLEAEEAGAEAEVALAQLDGFAAAAGRSRDAAELLAQLADGDALTPVARDFARTYLGWHLRRLGLFEEAAAEEQALGTVLDFLVVGPFDNERGRGFSSALPPEAEDFDPAARWRGKGLEVAWRDTPVREGDGMVELEALFEPSDQCLAYALTYLHADGETPVALRLGSDEAAALWVNRVPLLTRAVRREYSPDQDVVGVVLQPGWNEVLLKVADQTGDWRFRLRVTAPAGGPVAGVRAATHAEVRAKPAFPKGTAPRCEVAQGGLATLTARVARYPQDDRAWFHLAHLHQTRAGHDETEHPDREAFEKAAALRPGYSPYLVHLASALGGEGGYSVNAEHNARRAALERAVADGDPQARELLARYYMEALDDTEKAVALLRPALETAPDALGVRLAWMAALRRRGQAPLAEAELRRLCAAAEQAIQEDRAEHWPEPLLREALREAARRDDGVRTQELLERVLQRDASDVSTLARLAEVYARRRGGALVAEQLLRRAIQIVPSRASLRLDLARLLSSQRRLDAAAEAVAGALALRPQDPELLEAAGRLAERRGQAKAARALYDDALALDPKRVKLKKYLAFLDRREKGKAQGFEAAWVIDPAPLLAAARAHPLDKTRTHRVVLRQEVDLVNPDGTKSTWKQEVLRVESREGANALRTYGATYESDQRIEVQLARVYRARGGTVDAPVGSAGGDGGGGEFTSGRRYGVRFPNLEEGDAIEVRYRTDDLEQGFFGDYYGRQVFFQDFVPVDHLRFALIAPAARELYFHSPGGRVAAPTRTEVQQGPKGETRTWVWERKDIEAFQTEPNMPWLKESLPQLQVSTFKDWDSFARWYWGLVKGQQEVDEAMRQKVSELVAGAKSDEEKIRRIYEFVVTEVRYNGEWEFGVHGFKPYNATKIFARRFGDCKDKATLIDALLSCVGIKAHPVLIFGEDGRGAEDLSLPLMSHFNHCISWVDWKGGVFLDGTAEWHPYGTLPTMDYGARVVVIAPDRALLKEIPFRGPEANQIQERHEVRLQPDGSGKVTSTLQGTGTFEVVLRSWLRTEGSRKEVLEPKLGGFYNGAKVEGVSAGNPVELGKPFPVKVEAVIPRMLRPGSGGLELVELRSWLFDLLYLRGGKLSQLAADAERKSDVVLQVPSAVDEEVRYVLPAGQRVRSLPAAVKLETPFGSYQRVYVRDPQGGLSVRRVLSLKSTRIPQADYEAFRKFVEQIDAAERERPIIEQGGGEQ